MAGMDDSFHDSEEEYDSESFIISDDDKEEGVDIIIPDSSDTESSDGETKSDGRITPLVKRAVRRSLHHFRNGSDEENGTKSEQNDTASSGSDKREDSDSDESVAYVKRNHKRTNRQQELDLDDSIIKVQSKPKRVHRYKLSSSDDDDDEPRKSIETVSDDCKDVTAEFSTRKMETTELSQSKRSVGSKSTDSKLKRTHRIVDSSDEDYEHRETMGSSSDDREDGMASIDDSGRNMRAADESASIQSIHLDSSDDTANSQAESASECELAMSIAEEESKHSSLDAKVAQKKAYLETQQKHVERQLAKSKMLLSSGQLNVLPDKGEKIRLSIVSQEDELRRIKTELKKLKLKEQSPELTAVDSVKKTLFKDGSLEIDPTFLNPTTATQNGDLGKKALETFQREQVLTVERLKDLHGSLLARPAEDQLADDPRGLKVKLMTHQKSALTWLLWRESQNPAGGVLADDMGLGKTLTMISLVIAANQTRDAGDDSSDEEGKWLSSARTQRHLGGTLVVAPASLVAQWQSEVKNRCKPNLLTVELYHGNNREANLKRLARNDIVITTYNILSRAFKTSGTLFKIHWKRAILDEAHVIRNHKSQTCEAVCGLSASKRWVLTGTPVHNKEMDLFSLLKFLKCSPFDDVRVWKRWVDNKNFAGSERLATVMKTIMLRRTKQELQAKGHLDALPDKVIETIEVKLDPDERVIYDKVMVFSRTLFAQFLTQRAEKAHMAELGAGRYDQPSWQTSYRDTQFTKAQKKLLSTHADVAAHQILVLILRLRQLCCHPSLIHSMLDGEDLEVNGLEGVEDPGQLVTRLNDMSLREDDEEEDGDEIGVDERVFEDLLTSRNPVFNRTRQSSKMKAILEKIEEIVENRQDKVIVVSQWTAVLDIMANDLKRMANVSYRMFTGKIAVKDRQGILDDFNSRNSKTNVLLLSLTAGGVGLNLVGANHLILMDIHWNPQLESQAQDRIYRFGQKKDVWIYKYICSDTIEERIRGLQEKKLQMAKSLLSGSGKAGASKLSLDEMRSLFGV